MNQIFEAWGPLPAVVENGFLSGELTVAFPDAECKFFLTAAADERARRRQLELAVRGESVPFEELLTELLRTMFEGSVKVRYGVIVLFGLPFSVGVLLRAQL